MTAWWNLVVAGAPASVHAQLTEHGLADRVTAELATARHRWPDATVTDDAFAAAVAERITSQRELARGLPRLRIEDLFLAQWCASGDPRAITAFEQVYRTDVEAVLARFRRLAVTSDELLQTLRIKLFVGAKGRAPRISDYSGFGFLQNWLRVTALRTLVDVARGERARRLEDLLADDDFVGMPAVSPDVGTAYSQDQVSRAIKQAFARAVSSLAPRQRNFLRHAHVDSLTLDQIAALYSVHRATVARTLAQARAELVEATRSQLADALGVTPDALDSVVRAADSRIDLSLSRVLRAPELGEAEAEHA
ncbi:MAG: putative DNA-binding regulatory protein [Deltaproteobacteria bacterium]|nr:putative DNA-binding regulatory protein [Deltaproteobacteria bacterium]